MTNKPLIQTIAENTIGLITTAIFSVGLISSFGYLLFDTRNELNKMAQTNAEIEKEIAELNLGVEMATIASSGLFPDDQDAAILGTTLGLLKVNLPNDYLDEGFSKGTNDWCIKTLTHLYSAREKIGSYVFGNKIILQSQSATLKVYDTQITLIEEMLGLIQHWQKLNFQQRQSQYSTIQLKWIDLKASVAALDTSRSQIYSDMEIALKQNELRADEFTDNYNSFILRSRLSILGVLLGMILLSATVMFFVRKHRRPQKKLSKISVRKSTKGKPKKK